jgi:hypothetical protein
VFGTLDVRAVKEKGKEVFIKTKAKDESDKDTFPPRQRTIELVIVDRCSRSSSIEWKILCRSSGKVITFSEAEVGEKQNR